MVVVDDLSTGKRGNVPDDITLYCTDITDGVSVRSIFEKECPDFVIHLAAQISVSRSVRDPVGDARHNVIGLLNVLQNCVAYGVKKVVFASSGGAIYGNVEHPVDEQHPTIPQSPYAVAKLAGELYLDCFARLHDLPYVSLRYANVYGPRQNAHGEAGVVALFIHNLLGGIRPTIYGDGLSVRDFVYVKDVARANVAALALEIQNRVYNIGTGVGTNINELYRKIAFALGSKVKPIYDQVRPGDIRKSILSSKRAEKELGWHAVTTLEEGLKQTIASMMNEADE